MKKILFITNMYPIDKKPYFGIFIKEQILELKKGYEFDYKVHLINGLHKSKFEYIKSILQVPKLIRSFKPDVIHVHYGISGLFLLFYKPTVPVYLTLHGCDFLDHGDNRLQVWLSKAVARRVDKIYVQNSQMLEVGKQINNNIEILTCGVDTDFFKPDLINEYQESEKVKIVFPSDPSRSEKNYGLYNDTIKVLEENHGYKVEKSSVHNMTREEVRTMLSQADCLLMTSISEGSPQVVKEALSCGLPVVSVDVGNVGEMIEGIPSCFLSKNHDAFELAGLLVKSIESEKEHRGAVREKFMAKNIFSNRYIANRIWGNYNF
ncbi:glycosyltransferase family 4 protein [Mongoliibacter ruber]|uniref:Glycosyltransferase involved in cell wall biosynthesis n=1 Tax=Mongoliibacter ruber TaxID=1750599 RepID=A0A2T0WW19_9BACT|nr:glycosyltransferase involved in cell wall biosynthesis [Mongoliibacter ruber]